MKVGIDVTSLGGGRGPARYTREIIKALGKCCQDGDLFYLYSPYDWNAEDLSSGFTKWVLPKQWGLSWLNWTLPRRVSKEDIELMFFPANDFWLWPYRRTLVAVLDVAPATILRTFHRSAIDRLQNRLQMWRLMHVAEKVITISEYSARQIKKITGIPDDKIHVVHCGVSPVFKPRNGKRAKSDNILFLGSFDRRKNLDRLLDAYVRLLGQGRPEKLVLAGHSKTGGYEKLYYNIYELVRSKKLEDKVEVIENPTDDKILELYQTAKLFVSPSLIEGFGLPVLEAMACGCPVVCSKAASLPEVGGEAAVYFDPYDVDDMADKIMKALKDRKLREDMVSQGLKRARGFSWDVAASKVYQIMTETAQRKK